MNTIRSIVRQVIKESLESEQREVLKKVEKALSDNTELDITIGEKRLVINTSFNVPMASPIWVSKWDNIHYGQRYDDPYKAVRWGLFRNIWVN